MATLPVKITSGIVALGTLGTATYFSIKALQATPVTIEEKLKKENFKFIEFGNIEQWDEEFISDSIEIKTKLGNNISSGSALRDKCKSMMESDSVKNESDIESVKKWCGIRSISNQLARKGKQFLVGLQGTQEDVDAKWKATYDKHKSVGTNRTKLGLQGSWPSAEKDALAELKTVCDSKGKEDYLISVKEMYTVIENLCTIEGAKA